jgi:hypothetical protein
MLGQREHVRRNGKLRQVAEVLPRQHYYAALWPETSEARQICENSCKGTGHVTFALSVPVSRPKPGTVLVRDYHGQRHTVTVAPDGFNWQGTT